MARLKILSPKPTTDNDACPRRRTRERLGSRVLEELWSIWRADPRVPSIKSRRSWAISRNATPRLVDSWFLRRRTCAKKAGQPVSDDSYDLSLDLPIVPKREQSADLASDDTAVYPPDTDDLVDADASSDTFVDEDAPTDLKRPGTPAYNEASCPEHDQPEQSPIFLCATRDFRDEDTLLEDVSLPFCSQGRGNFTCMLCSSTQDMIRTDSNSTSSDSPGNMSFSCLRLDFSPAALSELSAIPFLFRTPTAVPPESPIIYQRVDDWTIDNELARLINDGKLDFSFLDAPHLTFMELID